MLSIKICTFCNFIKISKQNKYKFINLFVIKKQTVRRVFQIQTLNTLYLSHSTIVNAF